MAKAPVDIDVQVRGERKLDGLVKKMGGLEREVTKVNGKLPKAANQITKTGRAAQQATGKVGRLTKAFGGLRGAIAGIGAGLALRKAFGDASGLESAQSRIQTLTKNFQQLDGIQQVAAASAKKFRLSQEESLTALTDLGNRLGETASLKDIENIYEGFNTLLANNKVNAQNAASATLQLNQALGSGRLAGEEFNAINEATPQLLSEVARVMGVTRGELKQLAADGEISSAILIKALTNIRKDGAEDLETAFSGAYGATREFNAALQDFSATVGEELLPVITPLLRNATELLKAFGDLPGPVKTLTVAMTALLAAAALLAPAFGVIGGAVTGLVSVSTGLITALKTQTALMVAFGPKIYATSAAVGVLTKAMALLNSVLAVAPWALLAGALVYVGKGALDARTKIDALEAKLRDTTGTGEALKQKMNETAAEIERLKGQIDKAGPSADYLRKKIELLTASLQAMQGRYDIEIVLSTYGVDAGSLEDGFYGPGGAAPKPKPKPKPKPTITAPTGGGSSGGGGAAQRESELPQLQRQVELSNKLLENDRQRLEAQYQGNTAQLEGLARDRVAIELAGKKAEIAAKEIPDLEKQEKVKLALNEASLAIFEIENQSLELAKQKKEALEGTLQPIQDEIALLKGKLAGNEEEIRQLIEIRNLKKQIAENGGDQSQAEGLVKQRDALKEQAEAADKLKAQYKALANTIAGELTGAFKSIIDGSKTAEEALSDAFAGIADAFLDMAMKMIQQWLVMQALGILMPGPKGPSLGGGGGLGAGQVVGSFAGGGYTGDGARSGGVDGQGGFPAILHPQETVVDHSAGMSKWSGANGGSNQAAGEEASGGGGAGGNAPMNFNFSTVKFADQDYVDVNQLEAAMAQAAASGAKQGESRTLRRLQMSPGTRRKVGM